MDAPGADQKAGGQEARAPPPPPPQTQTTDTAGGDAATPPPPPRTGTAGPGPAATPPRTPPTQNQTAQTAAVQPQPPPPTGAGEVADAERLPRGSRLKKKLQKCFRFVKDAMSWYAPHRSREKSEETKPSTQQEEGSKPKEDKAKESTKQTSMPAQGDETSEEKKQHKKWPQVEVRLENILEEACKRLLAADLRKLDDDDNKRRCLLTFSVFALDSKVKKQAVTYWWATRADLPPEEVAGAEDIFSKLCDDGFLEPIKNRCSEVIHGCRVNPLVHWMVKHQARGEDFADLDDLGDPAKEQPKSDILCLTASYRGRLQKLPKEEWKARRKDQPEWKDGRKDQPESRARRKGQPEVEAATQGSENAKTSPNEEPLDRALLRLELEKKRVILNVSAHVYRLPALVLSTVANRLVVLQLGQWWNSDDETYMEVDGLETLSAIGKLKNLRYLGLRGLSRLTELPKEIWRLPRLAILDVRGCQNLVKVAFHDVRGCQNLVKGAFLDVRGCQNLVKVASQAVKGHKALKGLTHLDLTECYMLEHIGTGITSLSELQVFKGFVFGVGKRRGCRLQDLKKLKKLRKLSINVTTDANVETDDMTHLKDLVGLLSLTVTWGELPSILLANQPTKNQELKQLLKKWTGLVLPPGLEKLDVRCYPVVTSLQPAKDDPKPKALAPLRWFKKDNKLEKLYVRGGEVEELDIPSENNIKILRLRYLRMFNMKWECLHGKLKKVERVEVVVKDAKVMKFEEWSKDGEKDKVQPGRVKQEKQKKARDQERELVEKMKARMEIPGSTLDENGVWVRDEKEIENKKSAAAAKQPAAPASGADGKKEEGTRDGTDKSTEPSEAAQSPAGMAPEEEAHKTEAAAEVPKASEEAGKGGDDAGEAQTAPPSSGKEGGQGGSLGGTGEADETPTEEDGAGAPEVPGEVKKVDGGGDAGKAQTEGEEEGRGGGPGVAEKVDEQPTREDGGEDEISSPADATRSPVARPSDVPDEGAPRVIRDLEEEAPAEVPAASAPDTTQSPVPPATSTSSPAPAAAGEATAKPTEPGKADDDDGSTVTGTDTRKQ